MTDHDPDAQNPDPRHRVTALLERFAVAHHARHHDDGTLTLGFADRAAVHVLADVLAVADAATRRACGHLPGAATEATEVPDHRHQGGGTEGTGIQK